MKLAAILLLLLSVKSFASEGSNTFAGEKISDAKFADTSTTTTSRWSLEGDLQAHSVAGAASPWMGIATAYRILDSTNIGIRGYVPLSHTVDDATYALQAYTRVRLSHKEVTDFFFEPSFSEDFYNLLLFNSYGLAVGAMTRVSPGLSVGINGGFELAKVVVDSVGLERENGYAIYPKISLLANLTF